MRFKPRFGLRTLFVLVTACAALLAVVCWNLRWMHERRLIVEDPRATWVTSYEPWSNVQYFENRDIPLFLKLFGEKRVLNIRLDESAPAELCARLKSAFPEARLQITDLSSEAPDKLYKVEYLIFVP